MAFDSGCYNASANRAYYAAFHAVIFYLLDNNFNAKIDHKTDLSLFINEFINKKKIFSSKYKEYLYDMRSFRNNADYKSGVSKKISAFQLKMSKDFCETILKDFSNENES
ncbi:MAG: hypothetical protein QG635_1388 [Bacteroidota bacterium]|nr:hypothetical protein [Bacteroidota bacterium]